ncbi:MAG: DUF4738 domain-containing protein [Prevotella sp.]|nr:DUF4738 domain-containing protein [Prevotella sp.]
MKRTDVLVVLAVVAALLLAACGGKKKSEDIIAQRVVKSAPSGPIKMQEYSDDRQVDWIGKRYRVVIHRMPADSLQVVTDETGQQYVDNVISLTVSRSDGSVFYSHVFRKSDFLAQLDADYAKTGILEGLVFDKADGDWLVFAASVCHPQADDEYIPMVFRLSRMSVVEIRRDTQMDTNAEGGTPPSADGDDDGV